MTAKLDAELVKIKSENPDFEWERSGFDIVYQAWKIHVVDANEVTLHDFAKRFIKGYNNRPSVRKSNEISTIPDKIIDEIIHARVPRLTKKDIGLIQFGHRLSMATENILGLILEEYIHGKAIKHGWACCWGYSITSVDFCSSAKMLQVKNRSNTENSSSNKIRAGTRIEKWYRINALNGTTNWLELDRIIGVDQLFSEGDFIDFAKNLIKNNPAALYVDNPHLKDMFSD